LASAWALLLHGLLVTICCHSGEPILVITGIRVYDAAGNVIEMHEHKVDFKEA
jgi:hypothetical protein